MSNPHSQLSQERRSSVVESAPGPAPQPNRFDEAPPASEATLRIDHEPHDEPPQRRRAAWRQMLVQAERGFVGGIRSGSAFFVHFFGISIVIAAALVLGIEWTHWIGIAGCLTLVLTAEMFNQALKALAHAGDRQSSPHVQRALAIGTAAVVVACAGSTVVLTLIFWHRFQQMFAR